LFPKISTTVENTVENMDGRLRCRRIAPISKDLPWAKVDTAGFYGICVTVNREMRSAAAPW